MPSHVQSKIVSNAASTTPALAYTSSVTAGSTLILVINWGDAVTSLTSVADSVNPGNWTQAAFVQAQSRTIGIFYKSGALAGVTTVTATLGASIATVFSLYEIQGIGALDKASASGNGVASTACLSDLIATIGDGEFVVSGLRGGTVSAGTPGWTLLNTGGAGSEFIIPGGPPSWYQAAFTTASSVYVSAIASFLATDNPLATMILTPWGL